MPSSLPRALRIPLVPLAAVVLAATIWAASTLQRDTAADGARRTSIAQDTLTAMLDQETGLRGYLLSGDTAFLEPYASGNEHYTQASRRLRRELADDPSAQAAQRRAEHYAEIWRRFSRAQLQQNLPRRHPFDAHLARRRKQTMDDFRAANGRLVSILEDQRAGAQTRATRLSAGLAALVLLLLGGLGAYFTRRRRRAELEREREDRAYAATQADFAEVMSVVASVGEANDLLCRHLVRFHPGRRVAVLNRNNSENRLEAVTDLAGDDELAERLVDAEPASCVAVRLGRAHEEAGRDDALIQCAICGHRGESQCQPLLVSGRVIGSVLVKQPVAFSERERRRLRESVTQAAPVIGNLRAIDMAEARAATDALTDLANRRAVDDTLKRMVAQANRAGTPLAALAIDLDRFKSINDEFGHDKGDEVLAAVGATLTATLRGSDFAGRLGGEEFVILAPNTSADGGLVLAEKVRGAIEKLEIRDLDRPVTTSVGVAELPGDAADAAELLRRADRALYTAKARGRNRVETAAVARPA
jgi:diguanylate cyclase (GGDEF)-like protein